MRLSLVICSIESDKFNQTAAHYQAAAGPELEIIRIQDAKSLAEGYNRGIDRATGDVVILSHDDVSFHAPRWWERLLGHLGHCDLLGLAGASYYTGGPWGDAAPPFLAGQVANPLTSFGSNDPGYWVSIYGVNGARMDRMQVMDGLFLAAHRRVLEKVRFDAQLFTGFHGYDLDFTYSAYCAGFRLAVATDMAPVHASQGNFDESFLHAVDRVRDKHQRTFGPRHAPICRFAGVKVQSLDEMLRVMLPGEFPLTAKPQGLNIMGVAKG